MHRSLVLGLLWFLQNDPEVPAAHRALANEMHLPKDEFTDNAHFPWQLYVREGRRLIGEYTLTEHDITGKGQEPKHHANSIAVGEFPIDSFPTRKHQPGDTLVLEGYLGMLDYITRPYEIPYRIMIPEKIDGLIVPVAASTTHVAFSSIRMEPTWMSLGQAAGVLGRGGLGHLHGVVVAGVKGQEAVEPTAALAEMVEGAAGRDGMQPGAEAGVGAEGGQLFPDREPDLLADVAGVGLVVQDGADQPEGALVVCPHDDPKRRFVATLGAAEFCYRIGERARGDAYLETVRAFTPASGDLSEQFDQTTGAQTSARHLAWSYAAFMTAIAARRAR